MKKGDNIEELFKDGFNSFEPKVPTNAWNAINNNLSNIGATSVATSKGLVFGVSMAVTSLVGLLGINTVVKLNDDTSIESKPLVSVLGEKTELNETVVYQKAIDLIAKEDKVVRTNIVEIKNSSVVSEKQKEIAKDVLEEPLKDLVIVSESTTNDNIVENTISKEEIINNYLIDNNAVKNDKVDNNESKLEDKPDASTSFETEDEAVEKTSKIVRIPNVFTPNGDFLNDEFYIESIDIEEFYVRVIDVKGNTIFESTDLNFRWNGMDQFNNKVPEGNYYCVLKAMGTDGETHSNTSLLYIKR